MPANIRFQDISSLIDFMYHGEVAIPTEDVNQFLAVAEQFKAHTIKFYFHQDNMAINLFFIRTVLLLKIGQQQMFKMASMF